MVGRARRRHRLVGEPGRGALQSDSRSAFAEPPEAEARRTEREEAKRWGQRDRHGGTARGATFRVPGKDRRVCAALVGEVQDCRRHAGRARELGSFNNLARFAEGRHVEPDPAEVCLTGDLECDAQKSLGDIHPWAFGADGERAVPPPILGQAA